MARSRKPVEFTRNPSLASSPRRHLYPSCRAGRPSRADRDIHVAPQSGQENHEALDGKPFEAVVDQRRDFGLVHAQQRHGGKWMGTSRKRQGAAAGSYGRSLAQPRTSSACRRRCPSSKEEKDTFASNVMRRSPSHSSHSTAPVGQPAGQIEPLPSDLIPRFRSAFTSRSFRMVPSARDHEQLVGLGDDPGDLTGGQASAISVAMKRAVLRHVLMQSPVRRRVRC